MKKLLYMAVAAMAALSSCAGDDAIVNEDENPNENPKVEAPVFTATIEGEATTRTSIDNGSETGKMMVNWSDGDRINVNGSLYSTTSTTNTAEFTLVDGQTAAVANEQGKYTAVYPASLYDGNIMPYTLPASYTYTSGKFNMPMYAESENTTLAFRNLCGVLAITVPAEQMSNIKTFEVSSNRITHGHFDITVKEDGTLQFATLGSSGEDNQTVVDCGSGVAGGNTFYVPLFPQTYYPITIKISDGTNTRIMQTTKIDGIVIERNNIYPITFAENYKTIGTSDDINLLPGVFTVAKGKTVRFTRSNLYWNVSAYHFEPNQTGHLTRYNLYHTGHFFWTKTAQTSYQMETPDLSYSTTSDKFWLDGSDADHKLTVDGTTDLYVLSDAEWKYLYQTRKNASSLRKNNVTVAGTAPCLIIAPDGYDYNSHPLQASYTAETWAEAEALGLVCLPPTNYRTRIKFSADDASNGYYWTSTPNSSDATQAGCLRFNSSTVSFSDGPRSCGYALRLVK